MVQATMLLVALAAGVVVRASGMEAKAHAHTHYRGGANPIKKVITMLKMIQGKIEKEGEANEEIFDKYMCYCKTADAALQKSIQAAKDQIPQLQSSLKETKALHTGLIEELKVHKSDRIAAKEAVATANALRKKDSQDFATESIALSGNIKSLGQAITMIGKGSGGFLQTSSAGVIRKLTLAADMSAADRDLLSSFLSEGQSEKAPGGEILGILKQMNDEMVGNFNDITTEEESKKANFESLVSAKKKEIAAATKAIEIKTGRVGELAVKVTTLANDLSDQQDGLVEDSKFLADMDTICKKKKVEYEAYTKASSEELLAIADVIKILNDDDAKELFKKTLDTGGAAASSLQVESVEMQSDAALSFLQTMALAPHQISKEQALRALKKGKHKDPRLDFLVLTLRGQKIGFGELIAKIDSLAALIKDEQVIDDNKRNYCEDEIDKAEDEKKAGTRAVSDRQTSISDTADQLGALQAEMNALTTSVMELDAQVAEATALRKKKHAQNQEALAADNTALRLLEMAKNRLQKFYNPKLYKAPKKAAQSEAEEISSNFAFVQTDESTEVESSGDEELNAALQAQAAPGKPPEANFAKVKKTEESGGVMALMDLMKEDIRKLITEINAEEKNDQADYESFIKDSADKRTLTSKSIAGKQGDAAEMEESLHKDKGLLKASKEDLAGTTQELFSLHGECDWLLNNFDLRKTARVDEVDALNKAKAVLSGADYE